MKTNLVLFILTAIALASSSFAEAATRTVCFDLVIHNEDQGDCPSVGGGHVGVRRECNMGGYVRPVGLEVELWDADDVLANDDYIGTWRQQNGLTCVTFTWEGASYQENEPDPDVYVKIKNRVLLAGSTTNLRILTEAGSVYTYVTSRSMTNGIANNCHSGQCLINNGDPFYVNGDQASDYSWALMAMDDGQRTLAQYWTEMPTGTIDIVYPSDIYFGGISFCDGGTNSAVTTTRHKIDVCPGWAFMAQLVPHELGHVVMGNEFGLDPVDFVGDYTKGGGASEWNPTSDEYDGVAVAEGWANYVAAVSWWDPENTGADPFDYDFSIVGDDKWVWIEDAAPWEAGSCGLNRGVPLQVTKAFWDLDDAHNEAATAPGTSYDTQDLSTTDIAAAWSDFASGTGNHQTQEITVNENGDNIWDFWYRLPSGSNQTNFAVHNCVQSQQYP